MKHADKFFAYARERYEIHLRRSRGDPEPWTQDKILRRYPFCNVFREDDRTTRWFREHVREPMRDRPEVLLATVVFRMFNRISTGEVLFGQRDLISKETPFEEFLHTGKTGGVRAALRKCLGDGPYVTGSYIISSPPGLSKLDGMLEVLRRFYESSDWKNWATALLVIENKYTLEEAWEWLKDQDYLGKFHSYEIVTDLRHTRLLERAPDIDTWASPGPGARRGLNRVRCLDYKDKSTSRTALIEGMRELLSLSRDARMWPRKWPRWEMREVEHTLCEFDKMERTRLKQGRPRGVFEGRARGVYT